MDSELTGKKKIFVMSRGEFKRLMERNNINDSNVEDRDVYIISINDILVNASDGNIGFTSYFKQDHPNVLRTAFADIETEKPVLVEFTTNEGQKKHTKRVALEPFGQEQAKDVFDFLLKLKELDSFVLIIHCTAGISRSGAVGEFACKYLEADYKRFRYNHPFIMPNTLVMKKLWDMAGVSNRYVEPENFPLEEPVIDVV